jgi:hypothetical protein
VELVVHRLEPAHRWAGALTRSEQEDSSWTQGVLDRTEHTLLDLRLEVDQEIPTGEEVDPREWRVADEVVSREDAQLSQRVGDPVSSTSPREEALESLS